MLTEVNFNESLHDTSYRVFKPDKQTFIVKQHLMDQKPSVLGMVCSEGVITRGMKVDPWWKAKESVSTLQRFPQKYVKLNVKVQDKVSTIQNFQKDNTRQAMFTVYKSFMDFEREHDYASCDDLLRFLDISKLDIRVIMSLLMASNPIKAHLSYRQRFYAMVEERSYMIDSFDQVRSLFERLR